MNEYNSYKDRWEHPKRAYKSQCGVMPKFYDDLVAEYLEAVKRDVINGYCKSTAVSYEFALFDSDDIDFKVLFWDNE